MVLWFMMSFAAQSAKAERLSIENKTLEVAFESTTGLLEVRDKRNDRQWRQVAVFQDAVIGKANRVDSHSEKRLEVAFSTPVVATGRFSLDREKPDLFFTLDAVNKEQRFGHFHFPHPFTADPKRGHHVLNYQEGLLLPATDFVLLKQDRKKQDVTERGDTGRMDYAFKQMNWCGLTDLEAGVATWFETPFDAAMLKTPLPSGESWVVQPDWLPSKGALVYKRKLIYHFTERGGYVALAKWAREQMQRVGMLRTLQQKAKENPTVDRLIGAVNTYVFGRAMEPEFIRELRRSGIERAMIKIQETRPYSTDPALSRAAEECGFLFGPYDNYGIPRDGAETWHQIPWPREVNAKLLVKNEDGSDYIAMNKKTNTNYGAVYEVARESLRKELERLPTTTRFLDIFPFRDLHEDWSPLHPADRRQSAQDKLKLARMISQEFKQLIGGENMSGFLIPHMHYSEGTMTLPAFTGSAERRPTCAGSWEEYRAWLAECEAKKKAGIPWSDEKVVQPAPSSEMFDSHALNPAIRIPLFELVAHDCFVASSHWRCANNMVEGRRRKMDLFNILYGNMPLWILSRHEWETRRAELVQSWQDVCGWTRKIGYDEMVDHRWLTPDRNVQETRFSSGWAVIVNFDNEKVYRGAPGMTVQPLGFHPYRWKSGG